MPIVKKPDLVADIASSLYCSKADAAAALDAVVDAITARVVAGDTVSLQGLVKIEAKDRPARQVRNVATGQMMEKAADRGVKVTALSGIKTAVNAA